MTNLSELNQTHLDVLQEIGNIGAGNAATALSTLLNKQIDMSIPAIKILDFNQLMEYVGGPDTLIVTVFLRIQGEAPGTMFFVLSPDETSSLVQQLINDTSFTYEELLDTPLAFSAISEIGNILSGSYLSALSDFTSINMQPTVPTLVMDMAAAILMEGLAQISEDNDFAIVIDTMIEDTEKSTQTIKGHFFLLPDPESFTKIFKALGVYDR
ncbi:chemotaxis protein CheC [Gracilibacillus marinus]|jgi:chemotaxis protein CheC|uniref:Chemotaxis protein CheC n=1 Tax=Gracilibacillus marinus TaxID=630535 RepID=A0ABV8VUT3_9BACI